MAILGHELRNPLAAAITGVSVVAEMVDQDDPRQPILARALADLQRTAGLVKALLDYGRSHCPRADLVDLAELVRDAAARCGPGITPTVQAPSRVQVTGDGPLLERVFDNLIENARGVGAKNVAIRLLIIGIREIAVDISDDGPGVPTELRDHIFEPAVSGRGSSGLGLAIVADIVAAHGGRISLLPTEHGARFRLILPSVCDQSTGNSSSKLVSAES